MQATAEERKAHEQAGYLLQDALSKRLVVAVARHHVGGNLRVHPPINQRADRRLNPGRRVPEGHANRPLPFWLPRTPGPASAFLLMIGADR